MLLHVSSILKFELSEPTPFIFIISPSNDLHQTVTREELILHPRKKMHEYIDGFGNRCQRLTAPKGKFNITINADVKTSENVEVYFDTPFRKIQELPDNIIPFMHPSRYCESDRLEQFAWEIVEDAPYGYSQVSRIHEWVRNSINYYPGSSYFPISTLEIKEQGYGVCRDLAHLCIALCRGINIPARIAVGYLYQLETMDLHAWFEAFIGGRWYTFDPIFPAPKGGQVITAYGRDAADADVVVYTNFGLPVKYSSMVTEVELIEI